MARVEEEDIETDAGDPDYDDWLFLPFVREGRRDVPYRLSAHYVQHKRSWGRLPMDRQVADLRWLLPQLQALRKPAKRQPRIENPAVDDALAALGIDPNDRRGKEAFDVSNITDALRWKDIETPDDVLLMDIIADARWPTHFWLELREKHYTLIASIEKACRPGMNTGKVGRPTGKGIPLETQAAMRKSATELYRQVKDAKLLVKQSRRDPTKIKDALNKFDIIAGAIRSDLKGIFRSDRRLLNKEAKDIVAFLVAEKHRRVVTTKGERKYVRYNVRVIRRTILP